MPVRAASVLTVVAALVVVPLIVLGVAVAAAGPHLAAHPGTVVVQHLRAVPAGDDPHAALERAVSRWLDAHPDGRCYAGTRIAVCFAASGSTRPAVIFTASATGG
jgi:hypothetical protein